MTAKNNGTLTELKARPVSAVTLGAAIPSATSELFGAKADAPFDTTRTLYGWPERPGLYCDLLRTRGLGLSTACLRDVDNDGRFDEGRRFDFNSGFGDLLGITPSGKIIGVRTTARPLPVPLPQPVPYTVGNVPSEVTGRLALKWRKINLADTAAAQLWLTTPDNYTGTEGLSEQVVQFPFTRAPLDVELYGIKLRVLGFDEKGAMRYRLVEIRDGTMVPLKFRGYTFRIMII
ncbi:hypothetical protein [Novosphingobium sp. Gsoil 351]|uniref:hypothetical protein n=1 Tax=Novosphingobium sp. Gsoil 351 TaxID=2675225 RepID=UPI001E3FA37B|nr:hypothetical protein [Novosphingobium sp. Gsoil 351]